MQPLFFYYVYAALWRFDMHDILLDCQLLLLWFWSHQQLQLITILHEITRYEKFRNATAFFSISLSTFFYWWLHQIRSADDTGPIYDS